MAGRRIGTKTTIWQSRGNLSWNVTADVLAGAANGWVIKKQNEGQAGQVKYYSREGAAVAGNPSLGPRLVLVY